MTLGASTSRCLFLVYDHGSLVVILSQRRFTPFLRSRLLRIAFTTPSLIPRISLFEIPNRLIFSRSHFPVSLTWMTRRHRERLIRTCPIHTTSPAIIAIGPTRQYGRPMQISIIIRMRSLLLLMRLATLTRLRPTMLTTPAITRQRCIMALKIPYPPPDIIMILSPHTLLLRAHRSLHVLPLLQNPIAHPLFP